MCTRSSKHFSEAELQIASEDFSDAIEQVRSIHFKGAKSALIALCQVIDTNNALSEVVRSLPSVDAVGWYDSAKSNAARGRGGALFEMPAERRSRVSLQLGIIRYLAGGTEEVWRFALQFFPGESIRVQDYVQLFAENLIQPFAIDFLRLVDRLPRVEVLSEEVKAMTSEHRDSELRVFISHSSEDVHVAEALVDLLRIALSLRAADVRCTSLHGYRMRAGALTLADLRSEIDAATAVVGLLSRNSLASTWCVFELGARWGNGKAFLPLLVAGCAPADLPSPLSDFNALRGDQAGDVQQLITDLGRVLKQQPAPPESWNRQVQSLVNARAPASAKSLSQPEDGEKLTKDEIDVLIALNRRDQQTLGQLQISGISDTKLRYCIDRLCKLRFVAPNVDMLRTGPATYSVRSPGRAYLIENSLVA